MSGHSQPDLVSDRAELLSGAILDSLALPSSRDREHQIVESHVETFAWLLQDGDFKSWLKSPDKMFWFTGLPGSGKSTCMRFVARHRETQECLGETFIASFFFWESGTIMQRSLSGLLRSLLYQLLEVFPESIPATFNTLWSEIWDAPTKDRVRKLSAWDDSELSDAFVKFFTVQDYPICLFIDGLDEFEGNHSHIIHMLGDISNRNVKICVSSRPWEVFSSAFGSIPTIKLQDHTVKDLRTFVQAELGLDQSDPVTSELVDIAMSKADGVFLWMSSMLKVLEKCQPCPTRDLIGVLKTLPSGLDSLYQHLVDISEDPRFLSTTIQLMRARETVSAFTRDEGTSLMTLWELVLAMSNMSTDHIQQTDPREASRSAVVTRERIAIASHGLIELQGLKSATGLFLRVSYVHRTVKDWLSTTIWADILALAPAIQPHLLHLQAGLLKFVRPLERPRKTRSVGSWWSDIVLVMTHARYIPQTHSKEASQLLDQFNDTLNWYWPSLGDIDDPAVDSWARTCFGSYEERGSFRYEEPFLSLAVKFGLQDYVSQYPLTTVEHGKSPLIWSTMYCFNRQQSMYPLSNPHIVRTLLVAGIDPNASAVSEIIDEDKPAKISSSPWQWTLESLQQAMRRNWIDRNDVARWLGVLELFLQAGADSTISVQATDKDTMETVPELFRRVVEMCPESMGDVKGLVLMD